MSGTTPPTCPWRCEDVERVRDADALVSQCFPALATLDCTALVEDALPEACMEQILF